jgi:hypothetical protein
MAMQTDVKATAPLTSTGSFKDQSANSIGFRARIKGIYAVCGASAGSVVITDGSGGSTLLTLNTPTAANAGSIYMLVPDQGILAENGLYGTVTNTASITIFYG